MTTALNEPHKTSNQLTEGINVQIFQQMKNQQKLKRNEVQSTHITPLRSNFISWIYRIATKTELSKETVFNSVCLLDELISQPKNELLSDPNMFQLISVTCFFLSYKLYERKTMTIGFVEKSLLCGKWKEDDIRQAEIYILTSLGYSIHSINFYSFYQFYELIIKHHFDEVSFNRVSFLGNFVMKHMLYNNAIMLSLAPLEQCRLVVNTAFLLLQNLTTIDLSNYGAFFLDISYLSNHSNGEFEEFQKFSGMLIAGLNMNEDFIKAFARVQ